MQLSDIPELLTVLLGIVAAVKAGEIVADMCWTIRCGPSFVRAATEMLDREGWLDIPAIERQEGRPQPVYAWLQIRIDQGRPWARTLRRLYRVPEILTALALLVVLAPSDFAIETSAFALGIVWSLTALTLLNAPLRRVVLGPMDGFNRDLLQHRQREKPPQEQAPVGTLGRVLSLYFLWLVYVSIVGYASAYEYLASMDHSAFHTAMSTPGPITWLYFSVVTTATVGFGDIIPATDVAQALTLSQILTGPLLLSWLIAVFLGIRADAR